MKRFAFYIAVLLLTFGFSTAITKIYFVWNIEFWEFGRGSFATCGDFDSGFKGGGGFVSYQSYDGIKLAFSRAGFDTPKIARSCFQSELQKATKIVERETLNDEAGERIVAVFPPNEYVKTEWARIMILDEDRIFEITSSSLRHALIFEKQRREK